MLQPAASFIFAVKNGYATTFKMIGLLELKIRIFRYNTRNFFTTLLLVVVYYYQNKFPIQNYRQKSRVRGYVIHRQPLTVTHFRINNSILGQANQSSKRPKIKVNETNPDTRERKSRMANLRTGRSNPSRNLVREIISGNIILAKDTQPKTMLPSSILQSSPKS